MNLATEQLTTVLDRSASFEEIEKVPCPKCAATAGNRCWKMAGKGNTRYTRLIPHTERANAFFASLPTEGLI